MFQSFWRGLKVYLGYENEEEAPVEETRMEVDVETPIRRQRIPREAKNPSKPSVTKSKAIVKKSTPKKEAKATKASPKKKVQATKASPKRRKPTLSRHDKHILEQIQDMEIGRVTWDKTRYVRHRVHLRSKLTLCAEGY